MSFIETDKRHPYASSHLCYRVKVRHFKSNRSSVITEIW